MEIKSIKILGRDGCSNCMGMFQNTIDILAEKNIAADCQHVTDLQIYDSGISGKSSRVPINESATSAKAGTEVSSVTSIVLE